MTPEAQQIADAATSRLLPLLPAAEQLQAAHDDNQGDDNDAISSPVYAVN